MDSLTCGYGVVITMTKGRAGADVDERDIAALFQQLNFDVKYLKDRTKDVSYVFYLLSLIIRNCIFNKTWCCQN